MYNCFHENVNFNIGRKVLMQHGFQITPEKADGFDGDVMMLLFRVYRG